MRQHSENAGFGLAAQAEEEEIVFGEYAVDDLGDDAVAISDNAGEKIFAGLKPSDGVAAKLVLDGTGFVAGLP